VIDWGATALKTIYTGLMRSVFDYGCIAYGSASKTKQTWWFAKSSNEDN